MYLDAGATAYYRGMVMGALTAGVVSGLLPLFVGIWKNRIGSGISGFLVCVMLGFFSGIVLAGPAAIVVTLPILIGDVFDRWRKSVTPPPDRPPTAPETAVRVATTPLLSFRPAPMFVSPSGPLQRCSSCNHEFAAAAGSMPPWCPHCGADLKKAAPAPANESAAVETAIRAGAEVVQGEPAALAAGWPTVKPGS